VKWLRNDYLVEEKEWSFIMRGYMLISLSDLMEKTSLRVEVVLDGLLDGSQTMTDFCLCFQKLGIFVGRMGKFLVYNDLCGLHRNDTVNSTLGVFVLR
jgi:hypothetical protein